MTETENLDSYGESKDKKAGRGKRGALSRPEMNYIKKWADKKHLKELAKDIGKSVETIRKYAYKANIVLLDDAIASDKIDQEVEARSILRHREYWNELKDQFTTTELKVFEQIWAKLWMQFSGDLLASEEIQVKKYITLEIMRDRFGKQSFECLKDIERLKKLLEKEYTQTPQNTTEIKKLSVLIDKQQSRQLDLAKEQRETISEQKNIEKALKVSRDDRVKSVQDATKNWTSLLKLLNEDASVRTEIGKQIELMRISKDKSMMLLSESHRYVDGSYDLPILSEETIGEKDE